MSWSDIGLALLMLASLGVAYALGAARHRHARHDTAGAERLRAAALELEATAALLDELPDLGGPDPAAPLRQRAAALRSQLDNP